MKIVVIYIFIRHFYFYLLACNISQHLLCDDTGDNVGVLSTDSEVAVEAIVGEILVVGIVEGIVGNIVERILVLGIGVSSNLVVGLSVVDSTNIIEN